MSQGETGNEQDPRAGQSHAAMSQASSANQDSVPSADEDPYADLFGAMTGDTLHKGPCLGLVLVIWEDSRPTTEPHQLKVRPKQSQKSLRD